MASEEERGSEGFSFSSEESDESTDGIASALDGLFTSRLTDERNGDFLRGGTTAVADEDSSDRLSTGVDIIDERLAGGIPPGRIVVLMAAPDTQSGLLVRELVSERDTVYLSTIRPRWEIVEELGEFVPSSMSLSVEYAHPEALLEDPAEFLGSLPPESNLVIDPINEIELMDRELYLEFLAAVKETLWSTGSVGLLSGVDDDHTPPSRSLTLKRADLTWKLWMTVNTSKIEHHLLVSKFRGGSAFTEPLKLVLTDEITVDTSRDIA